MLEGVFAFGPLTYYCYEYYTLLVCLCFGNLSKMRMVATIRSMIGFSKFVNFDLVK